MTIGQAQRLAAEFAERVHLIAYTNVLKWFVRLASREKSIPATVVADDSDSPLPASPEGFSRDKKRSNLREWIGYRP